jgi:catalase
MWYNAKGEYYWIKWHFRTNQGIKNLTDAQATELAGTDPDYATRDLHDSIAKGDYPSWNAYVQIMTPEQAEKFKYDAFDITKVWSQKEYPLVPVGKFTLNRNPDNYFTQIEQAAFSPSNFVRGIGASPDKMLQVRLFSYPDTHRHRLGTNFDQIPVNAPKSPVHNYQRDGAMNMGIHSGDSAAPNYYPNSFEGPAPDAQFTPPAIDVQGLAARHEYILGDVDFEQAGELYGRVLSDYDKANLISNIVGHIKNAAQRIQYRQTALFYKAHPDYGKRVAEGLGLNLERIKELAAMAQEERVKATAV